MNRVTFNHSASSQLDGVSQPVQVFDENGKMLGHFVPKSALDPSESCPYSDDELEKMRGESGGRPLNEILGSITGK